MIVDYFPRVTADDLCRAYRKMDLLLVTGYREGGPLPLMEALASGVPVLTPAHGYGKDIAV